MPDLLRKVVTIFEDDGQTRTVAREYKTVLHEGEGAPRDVEITEEERREVYGAAHEATRVIVSELTLRAQSAEDAADAWRARAERTETDLAQAVERVRALESAQD